MDNIIIKRIIYSWPEFTLNNLKKFPYRYEIRMDNIIIEYISKAIFEKNKNEYYKVKAYS